MSSLPLRAAYYILFFLPDCAWLNSTHHHIPISLIRHWGESSMVECFLCTNESLSSIPSTTQNKRKLTTFCRLR